MKDKNMPAFPTTVFYDEKAYDSIGGLTKLEIFTMHAMQGMLSNPSIFNHHDGFPSIESLIDYSKKLLTALDNEKAELNIQL